MKIVVAITGASGSIYAKQVLQFLRETGHEVFVVCSDNGAAIFKDETGLNIHEFGFVLCDNKNFNVPFVSGSARFDAMAVIPCSMGTLGRIAHGVSGDVITRAADVFLKEKRKLILVPRDTPFSLIHIENLKLLSLAGATIIPAIPSYYSHPQTVDALAATVTARVLDHLGFENHLMKRWKEE